MEKRTLHCRNEKSCPYMHREGSGTASKENGRSPRERARDRDKSELATELLPQKAAERNSSHRGYKPGVCAKRLMGGCSRGDGCRFHNSRVKSIEVPVSPSNNMAYAVGSHVRSSNGAKIVRST